MEIVEDFANYSMTLGFREKVHLKVIGKVNKFPESLQKAISDVEKAPASYDCYFWNFAFAYGGRAEILDATRGLLSK